jgi:ribonuclease J
MTKLKFVALSGTTEVAENLYIYEYGNNMLVVDCGVGFPESGMYGVDLVIPDFSYIKENINKLKGVLISHGHEDHLGALPFLLKEIDTPVFATKLVAGFIEEKLQDHGIKNKKVNVFDPDKDTVDLGVFKITPFRVSHSVPDGVGFSINTPEGNIFHVADYKFDWTPVDNKPFDISKAAKLASEGVLMLASDALGSTTPGFTESERGIEKRVEEIVSQADNRVFFTTISSNISRIQQAINVAERQGRKVAVVGRSIDTKSEIAKNFGYLKYKDSIMVNPKKAQRMQKNKIMYIISGSYGQSGSSLDRVSLGEHSYVEAEPGDTVIFSSDPAPPGTKASVDAVVDRFIEMDVDVHYYDLQEDLHVSGHGSQEDIKTLFALVNPKYFVPIGATIRHMRAYQDIAVNMGFKREHVFEPRPGDVIEFENGNYKFGKRVETKSVLVDGLGIGDVGNVVLRDRQRLAEDGVVIVLIKVDKRKEELLENPEVISRGFVFEKKQKDFLKNSASKLRNNLEKKKKLDMYIARKATINFLEKYFYRETGRRPMILPVIVEV